MRLKIPGQDKIEVLGSDDVYKVMRDILLHEEKFDQDKEHFWIMGLSHMHNILYVELVSLGGSKSVQVEPMNTFRVAVLKNAEKVVLVHNHPSKELNPSNTDKDVTDRLIQVGRVLDVEVLDHLIISTESYMSFADTGLLEELKKSTKWVPPYQLVERIKKMEADWKREMDKAKTELGRAKTETARAKKSAEAKIGKLAAERDKEKAKAAQKVLTIAAKALKAGMDVKMVSKITGLTEAEIKKINEKK